MKSNYFFGLSFLFLAANSYYSQGCCSGGATNPIAGGAATGVLGKNKIEISANHQFLKSSKFYTEDRSSTGMFDYLFSNYLFLRTDYGLSDKLTFSMATGYFLNKSRIETPEVDQLVDTINSSGFSDIILLPRFGVFNRINGNKKTELTLGLGMKVPIGSHKDSSFIGSFPAPIGNQYIVNPPIAQMTSGSIDMMLYAFLFRSYDKQRLRVFTNFLHVRTGFNSLGQKFGDYTSLGFFVGRNLNKRIGITCQVRAEIIGQMKSAKNIDLIIYNIDQSSTGSFKTFFVPQLTYTKKNLTFYTTTEIPIYQYVNGTQIGSQFQLTTGINYRFQTKKSTYQLEDPLN